MKPHPRIPGAMIQYPAPLQVYHEQRAKVTSNSVTLPAGSIALEYIPGHSPRVLDVRAPPIPPSPSAFPAIMAVQTPTEASIRPSNQRAPASHRHRLKSPPTEPVPGPPRTKPAPKPPGPLPLANPFPKPAPQPVKEDEAQRPELPQLPTRVATGCEFEDAQHEDWFYLNGISDYGDAYADSDKVFRGRDVESVRAASERLLAASRLCRENMLSACSEEIRLSVHVQRTVQEVETWEILLESHCSKTRKDGKPEELDVFFRMGLYLSAQVNSSNGELARLMDCEFSARMRRPEKFAEASLPLEYDDAALKELHNCVKKGKKRGLLFRLVDQALSLKKYGASSTRKVPDVTSYPRAPLPETEEPVPDVKIVPEYFDDNCAGDLHDISLSLRAAVVAFHLVARQQRATEQMPPIPQYGNYLSTSPSLDSHNLPTLVRHLTDHFEDIHPNNMSLMDSFFHFFRYITTPLRLLQLLLDRYYERPPRGLSREENVEWRARHIFTKLFIVRIIAMWLDRYYLDCEDKIILVKINEFTFKSVAEDRDLPPKASWLIAIQLCECHAGRRGVTYIPLLEQAISAGQEEVKSYPATAFQKHLPGLNTLETANRFAALDILFFYQEGGAEEIARALTKIEVVRFHKSLPTDMINWKPTVEASWMTEAECFSRALNLWTSFSVIDHEYPAERAKAYEVLVEVAYVRST